MMIYRCTACTRDHMTGQQPAICLGCNLAAGNFAVIHLEDVELVEASPGFPDELKAEVVTAFDDAPPTPRDMPEPPGPVVLEGAKKEAEPAEVAELRPVVAKRDGICSQTNCDETATHRFTWPGHPEAPACHPHALKAVLLAEHMGFFLEAPAIDAPRPR